MILTILIVILGIALGVVFFNREKDEDKARLGIMGLTAAIVVLSLVRLISVVGGPDEPEWDTTVDQAIGKVMADKIAEVAQGKRVLIVAQTNTTIPYLEARLESVQEGLRAHNMEIVGVEEAKPPELLETDERYPDEGLDARGVDAAMQKYPSAEVVVSLAGLPGYNFELIADDLKNVEFFVFDEVSVFDWKDYLAKGHVDGIILQPFDSDWSDTTGSGEAIFDRRYVFVTPDTYEDVRDRVEDPAEQVTW